MTRLRMFFAIAATAVLVVDAARQPASGQAAKVRRSNREWSDNELFGSERESSSAATADAHERNSDRKPSQPSGETWRNPRAESAYYADAQESFEPAAEAASLLGELRRERSAFSAERAELQRMRDELDAMRSEHVARREHAASEAPSVRPQTPLAVGAAVEPVSFVAANAEAETYANTDDQAAATCAPAAPCCPSCGSNSCCGGPSCSASQSCCSAQSCCGASRGGCSQYENALGCCRSSYGMGRYWVWGEYLLWWVKGSNVPTLLTTSNNGTPVDQAGVLGNPNTETIFPSNTLDKHERHGGRIRAGMWLDACRRVGVQGDFFQLGNLSNNFALASNGNPILARPFYDVVQDTQNRELLAYPGIVNGGIHAFSNSYLTGAGVNMMYNFTPCCCSSDPCSCEKQICCPCKQVNALGGYRFMNLAENFQINQRAVITNPAALGLPLAAGTSIDSQDRFATNNQFHGGNIGLQSWFYSGRWSLGLGGSCALGTNYQRLQISGNTIATVPGEAPVVNQGGLFALPSNIGTYERDQFSVIPEANFTVGYAVTCNLRATIGYSFLYWTNVLRAGEQIDTNVNPSQFPLRGPLEGPQAPTALLANSDIWLQGLNLGLMYTW